MTLYDLVSDIRKGNADITYDNNPRNKKTIQEHVFLDKSPLNMTKEDIRFVTDNPVVKSRAEYYAERVLCPLCNIRYRRNNVTAHRRTKVHKALSNVNEKLIDLLLT